MTAEEQHLRAVSVRMEMPMHQVEWLADLLPRLPDDVRRIVLDQLWLKSVFIEQRRRTRIAERATFTERADRVLEALDPQEVIA